MSYRWHILRCRQCHYEHKNRQPTYPPKLVACEARLVWGTCTYCKSSTWTFTCKLGHHQRVTRCKNKNSLMVEAGPFLYPVKSLYDPLRSGRSLNTGWLRFRLMTMPINTQSTSRAHWSEQAQAHCTNQAKELLMVRSL